MKVTERWAFADARQCSKKRRYEDVDEARKVVGLARAKYGTETKPFFCAVCQGYHLTSKAPIVEYK